MKPIIDIKYSPFLDPIFRKMVLFERPHIEVPAVELVRERVRTYRKIWDEVGNLILQGISVSLSLSFMRNYIPVYVVGLNPRDFSNPLVLKSRYTRTQFIEAISHELIHCLCSDNQALYREPYPDNRHIIVHAALKYLYLDVLRDEHLLKENIETSFDPKFALTNGEYIEAWEFVGKSGYKNILESFRKNLTKA